MKPFNLKEYLANPSRKIVTRTGKNVKIYCTNFTGLFPIVAEIEGMKYSITFNKNGKYNWEESSDYDLFFAEEE